MKRRVLTVLMIVLFAGALFGQSGTFEPPWGPPVPGVEEGTKLFAVGFWADAVGIGFVTGASAAFGISFGAGVTFYNIGVTSLVLVGNPCLQVGLQQHHDALVAQGIPVPTANRDKARTLGQVTLGVGVASVGVGLAAAVADSTALAITSIVAGGVGAVMEIVNFYVFRRNWVADMKEAAGLPVPWRE